MNNFIYPILAYIIGSIPFGVIFTRLFGKGDITKLGSHNIGATNVVRTQGKTLGAMTFLFDFLKGFVACKIFHCDNEYANFAIIMAPVIGHMFPIILKFRGGKGVSTYFGVLAATNLYLFIATLVTWIAIFLVVKISSVASLVSCSTSLLYCYYMNKALNLDNIDLFWVLFALVIMIFVKHHKNISTLMNH